MVLRSLPASIRARGVTAILGPTNTGKTHLAIERLVAHDSGVIGLPLRLLAREVYQRVIERVGVDAVALITGEEKIKPREPRYWVATVEAMPRDLNVSFCAVDEIQIAADLDRGHVFTDRLLNQRGSAETLIIGAATMRPLVESLLPGANMVTRPRLSKLSFAGEKKMSRLPRRSAIVAFSAEEVYAIAELIRRQKGGAAVVLGALSPRTRNAQVALYQSGDVDYLVATDAIGMGLNLDVDHVAFASDRKFDGFGFRRLTPAEFGQIAGRAGRHMRDGSFGTTGRCPPFEPELVQALEDHVFDPVRHVQWRNPDLDFTSLALLAESLARTPSEPGLTRAPIADDVAALEVASRDPEVRAVTYRDKDVERLWEVCQVPDYRKVSPAAHSELVTTLYTSLMRDGVLRDDWFSQQLSLVDRVDGDIDTLSARIAQVRTWTFVANRPDWLADPEHWQGLTRQIEDRLSDALHERLASRFVDRRTSVLMRRLRENATLEADINASGDVFVEGQHVGRLAGFKFTPDQQADGPEAKALRAAAQKALASEIDTRAGRLAASADDAFVLASDGSVRWMGEVVAKLTAGDKLLQPRLRLVADEQLTGAAHEKVGQRLELWLRAHVAKLLGPLLALEQATDLDGMARGIGFQIAEALGVLERSKVAQDVKTLDQDGRASLRKHGVRFGAYHIYLPQLLKPAPRALAVQLFALKQDGGDERGPDDLPLLGNSGRTSIPIDPKVDKALYRAAGFRACGARAVRVDILERLADLIRPAVAYRPGVTSGAPPPGAADGAGFVVTVAMTSLAGCSGEDFASILRALGYVVDRRAGPAITVPLAQPVAVAPAVGADAAAEGSPRVEEPPAEGAAGEVTALEAVAETDSPPAVDPAPDASPEPALREDSPAIAVDDALSPTQIETPEQPAVAAAEVQAAEAVAPAEPVIIEVWRPQRHGQGRPARERRPERARRHAAPAAAAPRAPEGASAPGREHRRPRGAFGKRKERHDGDRPEASVGAENRPPREGRREFRERQERRGNERQERHQERHGKFQGKPKRERPAEKQPDPNSPFAKLLVLKQQLEARDNKGEHQ
jgi:ATP-dependent RNA helicase SUPV3L1/SUV3